FFPSICRMSLLRPLLMMMHNKAAKHGNINAACNFSSHLLRCNNNTSLVTTNHPFQFVSKRSLIDAYCWPFLRSTPAKMLYCTTLVGGGLVWKWKGRVLGFHLPEDYKLAPSIGKDSNWLSSFLDVIKLLARAFYLSILFTPAIAMMPFAYSFGPLFRKKWLYFVYVALEKAGPAFIKWGQWAATRRDLFPTDLCVQLSKLQTIKAPEHSFDYTKKTVEKAFGRQLLEIFEDFEEAPVGSGHVTQVHRATLRCDNPDKAEKTRVVAVKVRHPGVDESVMKDLSIVRFYAKVLSSLFPTSFKSPRFDETLQQFAVYMGSEVDLSQKAALLSCFYHMFEKSTDIDFVRPLYPLVHPDVLVEAFEEGESLAHYIKGDSDRMPNLRDRMVIVHDGTLALHTTLVVNKFIGADLSPRNIFFQIDKDWPRLVILDIGMTAGVPMTSIPNIAEVIQATGRRDGRTAAEYLLKLSKTQNCPYPRAFIEDVDQSFTTWDRTKELARRSEFLQRLLEKARDYNVKIDDNACSAMGLFLDVERWQQNVCFQSSLRAMQAMFLDFPKKTRPSVLNNRIAGRQWSKATD
ncbi:hypothetical protein IFM89_028170, partial [Coptis chinensis]